MSPGLSFAIDSVIESFALGYGVALALVAFMLVIGKSPER